MDIAHTQTDKALKSLEKRLKKEYKQAAKECQQKLADHLAAFAQKDREWQLMLQQGKVSAQEYLNWRTGQIMTGQRWQAMVDTLADDLHNVNEIAAAMARDDAYAVYAMNYNYGTYVLEHKSRVDTSFTLYNQDAVRRLARDNPKLLPDPRPDSRLGKILAANKDLRWQKKQINSVMIQGITQGESIDKMARRITDVAYADYTSAVRYARTMFTGVENKARQDAGERARDLGLDVSYQWNAILDQRTRHSHRHLNGETKKYKNDTFSNGLEYPGDTSGEPEEWWNCRCYMSEEFEGITREDVRTSPYLGDMSYEEWLDAKPMSAEKQKEWLYG